MINFIKNWRINRENKRFIERLRSGKVNYEFKLAGSENIDAHREIVNRLTSERTSKTYVKVKHLKDMDKKTFEETVDESFDSNKQ